MNDIFTLNRNLNHIWEIEGIALVSMCVWFGMGFHSLRQLSLNIWELIPSKWKLSEVSKRKIKKRWSSNDQMTLVSFVKNVKPVYAWCYFYVLGRCSISCCSSNFILYLNLLRLLFSFRTHNLFSHSYNRILL